ncbi:MAG: ribonuclease HII [Candidatus Nealsonbacteria bacterium]|nr:ribonuclease HII [Candidatus Nealsonbacteria bacterium]
MKYPSFHHEKKLWKEGYEIVIGIDEAGRGPLAGPVVAAAASVEPLSRIRSKLLKVGDIKDSKRLAERKRERIFSRIIDHPAVRWGVGVVPESIIDRVNILEATKLAMMRAVLNFQGKYQHEMFSLTANSEMEITPYFLLIDGPIEIDLSLPQRSINRADEKVFSCSLASIIAKVKRDQIMKGYAEMYPEYKFSSHKGYATQAHLKRLKKHGPCEIHRKSFGPVKDLATEEA